MQSTGIFADHPFVTRYTPKPQMYLTRGNRKILLQDLVNHTVTWHPFFVQTNSESLMWNLNVKMVSKLFQNGVKPVLQLFDSCVLTYSAIASRRKCYLNVCFYHSLLHGWYHAVIGTTLKKGTVYREYFVKFLCYNLRHKISQN